MNPVFVFVFVFLIFFFFYPEAREHSYQWVLCTVYRTHTTFNIHIFVCYVHGTHTTFNVHIFVCYDIISGFYVLFMRPTNLNFFIKNRSHDTIYIFKNYFDTVFSVFSFSNNKFNPNKPNIID